MARNNRVTLTVERGRTVGEINITARVSLTMDMEGLEDVAWAEREMEKWLKRIEGLEDSLEATVQPTE